MKKILSIALVTIPCVIPFSFSATASVDDYTLEQVVMLSRHGLRAPLANSGSVLEQSSPKQWPQWNTKGSYLTTKGGVLEAYFGGYINQWLVKNKLFNQDECPQENQVYIYANSLQRTVATAEYFSAGAFPGCNIAVVQKEPLGKMDYTFNPVISDDSDAFKQAAIDSMNIMAGEGGIEGLNQRLAPAYQLVDKLVDYANSPVCKKEGKCSITDHPTRFTIEKNKEPAVSGPLRLGTSISDAFILQYYQGFSENNVAWGEIRSEEEWKALVNIKDHFIDVLFGSETVAKQVASPLIKYINTTLINNSHNKFTLLVGHDSNVASVLAALKIKDYTLPGQFEKTPIGGKIAFERWQDKSGQQWIKIEYIYQTTDQIRQLQDTPPQHVSLEMAGCPVNEDGFCPLSDFEQVVKAVMH